MAQITPLNVMISALVLNHIDTTVLLTTNDLLIHTLKLDGFTLEPAQLSSVSPEVKPL